MHFRQRKDSLGRDGTLAWAPKSNLTQSPSGGKKIRKLDEFNILLEIKYFSYFRTLHVVNTALYGSICKHRIHAMP